VVRVVIAGVEGGGEARAKAIETLHPGAGPAGLTTLAERVGGVDLVIRVLPPGATVARVAALPQDPDGVGGAQGNERTADALGLMAETDLPSAIPAHRRAAGLINPGRNGARRPVALLTAWPETVGLETSGRTARIAPEVGISEVAAIAMLGQMVGGVERAWTIDRVTGAMSVLAAGPEKTVVRVARVPAGDAGAAVRRSVVVETSKAAGLGVPGEAASSTEWLVMEPAPASVRVLGEVRSAEWIGDYGLAAAAIAAFADANPAVNGLVGLHETEPKAKPPVMQRVTEWLGSPVRAAAIVVLCVVAAVGVPIGVSMAKVKLLEKAITDEGKLRAQNMQDDKDLAFARVLREKRWPMMKIMADIAGACPEGINIDTVELATGEGVTIRGLAEDTDKLSTFRERLGATRVFSDIAMPMNNPKAEGTQFQLTAKIQQGAALMAAKPADDFAAKTLFERIYHEKPRNVATNVTNPYTEHATSGSGRTEQRTDRSTRTDRTDRSGRTNGSSSGNNSRPTTSSRDSGRTSTSTPAKPTEKVVIPPPLSDAAIAKLSRDDAMLEWSKRRLAAKKAPDDATKERLNSESEKARARFDALNKGGG
jgi:hypothetical protein